MNNIVLNTIRHEINSLIALSQVYKNKRDTAKTKIKYKIYDKKLKNNNNKVYRLLTAAERLQPTTDDVPDPMDTSATR